MSGSDLSENERRALDLLICAGGAMLTSSVPDCNNKDIIFGTIEPGHRVYRKLEQKGFVLYTVEDPLEMPGDPLDGFVFTNEIYITDEGRAVMTPATKMDEESSVVSESNSQRSPH